MIPRGIRDNNPGNVRHVQGVTWQGQSAEQDDPAFVQFDDPVYGIRAIARIMHAYENQGIHTIGDAIDRWAPPNENNSEAYVEAVCTACSIGPDVAISLHDYLPGIIKAIIQHENGEQPYTDAQILKAIQLAGEA
jgi:hypothetical protein